MSYFLQFYFRLDKLDVLESEGEVDLFITRQIRLNTFSLLQRVEITNENISFSMDYREIIWVCLSFVLRRIVIGF